MVHLQTKSCYSLLQSPFRPAEIIAKAIENGFGYAALTDINTMLAVPEFVALAKKAGIKPILGLEIRLEMEIEETEGASSLPLLLLAKDIEGLRSLYEISTALAAREQTIDLEYLKKTLKHSFVLALSYEGLIKKLAEKRDGARLELVLTVLQISFDDFYLGICALDQGIRVQEECQWLQFMAEPLEVESAAISYIEYGDEEDYESQRLLEAIRLQKQIKDPSLKVKEKRFFRAKEQMEFLYAPSLLEMTDRIASEIAYDFSLQKNHLPVFENGTDLDNETYLKALAYKGLQKRLNIEDIDIHPIPQEYLERLQNELDLIIRMHFANYFLIVWDLVREARRRKILIGPGRGSAAGSLVSYCLGISHIDPVANDLLFERFLNPERISMPDIDIDLPDDHRDEMILYLQEKYGQDHVSHIITYQRMKAKAALRDAARAMQISVYEVDRLTRLIPLNQSLAKTYESNHHFRLLVEGEDHFSRLYKQAAKLEGLPRHLSMHAAGLVLSKEPIQRVAPLIQAGGQVAAEQFDMHYLEGLGLIKFDLLSLKNLSTLENIRAEASRQIGSEIDLLSLPLDQSEVYDLLSKGQGMGIFQLESSGIRSLLRDYKPEKFADIAAILALYRPGPMQNINLYLSARHKPHAKAPHPLLEELLKESHGIFLYQEQIMKAAQILAGFSLAQADSLRKAMSKKDRALMDSYRSQFLKGCLEKGLSRKEAEKIFALIERFSEYGFNKSHSYAYALIVYQMAYFKAFYPDIFYKHAMNEELGNTRKLVEYQSELKSLGLDFLPVSLSKSTLGFEAEREGFRFPFTLIKGLSHRSARKIIEEREKKAFLNLNDALVRLFRLNLEEEEIQTLIRIGALDEFNDQRESILDALDSFKTFAGLVQQDEESLYSMDSIDSMYLSPPALKEAAVDEKQRLAWQAGHFGFYPFNHPVAAIRGDKPGILSLLGQSGSIEVFGLIREKKAIKTKKGKPMSFITLEDEAGSIEMALMPDMHENFYGRLEVDMIIRAKGLKNRDKSFKGQEIEIMKK